VPASVDSAGPEQETKAMTMSAAPSGAASMMFERMRGR
jgi:hypothetical protein